jgi:hypothetical protein
VPQAGACSGFQRCRVIESVVVPGRNRQNAPAITLSRRTPRNAHANAHWLISWSVKAALRPLFSLSVQVRRRVASIAPVVIHT